MQEGLKEAHMLFRPLNMVPDSQCSTQKKSWHKKSWILERFDPKNFTYLPSVMLVLREDGDLEVLRDPLQVEVLASVDSIECSQPNMDNEP